MTNPIARPTFYEGEILPAADLGATVDYARNQMARHSRYLHSWGIATGLKLTFTTGVTVGAGVAIDGTGREIVVPADVQLDSTTFNVFPQTDPATLYPVFLNGVDQPASPSSNLTGACGGSQSTSMQETYQITFGSPGSELQVAGQTLPAIADGPDGGVSGVWLVLLGFATWDATNKKFLGVADFNPASKIGPQHVGVNAAQVISGSGSLLLATDPATPQGSNPVMAVQIQEAPGGGQLLFGKLGTDGSVTPAFTFKANGDLIATGQISGAVTPGSMQVQSGIAFDGMILPLPTGINPADAAAGKVTVHTHVSVHYESVSPPGLLVAVPLECRVDTSTRRVHCRVFDISTVPPNFSVLPAWCDYLVIVAVPASSGSGS
jgi:hypothetical protein